jgi:hypothetical protein
VVTHQERSAAPPAAEPVQHAPEPRIEHQQPEPAAQPAEAPGTAREQEEKVHVDHQH